LNINLFLQGGFVTTSTLCPCMLSKKGCPIQNERIDTLVVEGKLKRISSTELETERILILGFLFEKEGCAHMSLKRWRSSGFPYWAKSR
jgi:hypothetical protein